MYLDFQLKRDDGKLVIGQYRLDVREAESDSGYDVNFGASPIINDDHTFFVDRITIKVHTRSIAK